MNGAARTILIIASDPVDRGTSRTACARLARHAIEAVGRSHIRILPMRGAFASAMAAV